MNTTQEELPPYDIVDPGRFGYGWRADTIRPYIAKLKVENAAVTAAKDGAYLERNQVVAALAKCFPSGVARTAIEGWSEDWHGCVYIDLPTGQVSWHFHDSQAYLFADLPPYNKPWDGHDTPEKYRRVAALDAAQSQAAAMAGLLEEAREAIAEHHVAKAAGSCINCDVLARIESALAAWEGKQ
jgi:hypothetical protein